MISPTASPHPQRRPPNLLILGASGSVARALLRRLGGRRDEFNRVILVDRSERVLEDRNLEHQRLAYEFVRRRITLPRQQAYYRRLLRRYDVDIALDVTDMDSLPVLGATDLAGVSYIGTSLNDNHRGAEALVAALHPTRAKPRRAPHILCSGMNPGVVNIWVWHGVRRYGKPREIIHFEYDTSTAADGWRPIVTWSRKEFISELAGDPTGQVVDGRPVIFRTRAIQHRVAMRDILKPVFPLATYPSGFLVLHEENLTLGQQLGVSSKFIYAVHPKTMAYLVRRWRRRGQLLVSDLRVGDNTTMPLAGEDTIGVCLEYPRRRVYYLHSLANSAVMGANATCTQVAVGVYAALFTMLRDSLAPRIHFVSDLYDSVYPQVLFANMRVEHFVFAKRKRHLVPRHYEPALRPRFPHAEEQMVI